MAAPERLGEPIDMIDALYTEEDLDRIAAALRLTPCDPSASLILGILATLHASCLRGWQGDDLVHPPWTA